MSRRLFSICTTALLCLSDLYLRDVAVAVDADVGAQIRVEIGESELVAGKDGVAALGHGVELEHAALSVPCHPHLDLCVSRLDAVRIDGAAGIFHQLEKTNTDA